MLTIDPTAETARLTAVMRSAEEELAYLERASQEALQRLNIARAQCLYIQTLQERAAQDAAEHAAQEEEE